jgi:GT2 family glycosyltransferase
MIESIVRGYHCSVETAVPLVSYVLVNWRTEVWLARALRSIQEQDYGLREIFVVNNASPSWDPMLLQDFPEVQLIDLERNLGFAGGNNIALRQCHGDFVVLLNCDAYLSAGFVRNAIQVFSLHPELGSVAPKVLRDAPELDGYWRIDSVGHLMRRDRSAFSRGANEIDQGQYDYPCEVFGVSAAAAIYRRAMLDDVAVDGEVFDSSFFAYYEDVDLDWRARLCGWTTMYAPDCVAHHRGHGSGARSAWHIRLKAEKNRYLMMLKNDSLEACLRDFGPLTIYEVWHFLTSLVRPVQLLGLLLTILYIPSTMQRRARASAKRKLDPRILTRSFVQRGFLPPLPVKLREQTTTHGLARNSKLDGLSDTGSAGHFPLVSVVIVNFNGLELTLAALRGLQQQTYPNLEIIVVDNGSRSNEAREIRREHRGTRVLRLERNGGFSHGCNWGISLAQGEWVILLNNDAIPDPDCIRQLVYAQRSTKAAAVSGRLVDLNDTGLIGPALHALELEAEERSGECVVWDIPEELAAAIHDSRQNHGLSWLGFIVTNAYGSSDECFYPSGGLCCLPRSTLDALGPEIFPNSWFAYYEDVALGFRIRQLGWWVAKAPIACAVHLASSTARTLGSTRLAFLRERNRLQCLFTFLPTSALWRLFPLLLLHGIASFLLRLVSKPLSAFGQVGGVLWCCCNIPSLLIQRARFRPTASAHDMDVGQNLSGRIRGSGGVVNWLAMQWCNITGLPSLERRADSSATHERQ